VTRPHWFWGAVPSGVSNEKAWIAPGAGELGSAAIHGKDAVFVAARSTL
jgi:hypothetical protein